MALVQREFFEWNGKAVNAKPKSLIYRPTSAATKGYNDNIGGVIVTRITDDLENTQTGQITIQMIHDDIESNAKFVSTYMYDGNRSIQGKIRIKGGTFIGKLASLPSEYVDGEYFTLIFNVTKI